LVFPTHPGGCEGKITKIRKGGEGLNYKRKETPWKMARKKKKKKGAIRDETIHKKKRVEGGTMVLVRQG